MKKIFIRFFAAALFIAVHSAPLLSEPQSSSIRNFGQVNDFIYRGARLKKEADYKAVSELGVDTILSLERFNSEDQGLCKKYGLECVRFPLILLGLPDADEFFDYTVLQNAFQFLVDEVHRGPKVYIHCYYGKDRTGSLAAAFTIRENACGKERYNKDELWQKIESDLTTYGFHDDLYPTLKNNIRSWVYELPEWICRPPTSEDQH